MYNTKNYTEPGGEKTVIGGKLEFANTAEVSNFPSDEKLDVWPEEYEADYISPLTASATQTDIIDTVNKMRQIMIANDMIVGWNYPEFTPYNDFTPTDWYLKQNKQNRSAVGAMEYVHFTLWISANVDRLQWVQPYIAPYSQGEKHKYLPVGFSVEGGMPDSTVPIQLNHHLYDRKTMAREGMDADHLYILIPMDLLKPGVNPRMFYFQWGEYEKSYIHIGLRDIRVK